MAYNSRIILPFALWSENSPSLSVSSLYINSTSDDLITGTNDGFIICWKIGSDHQKVNLYRNELFFVFRNFYLDYSKINVSWSYKSSIIYCCFTITS